MAVCSGTGPQEGLSPGVADVAVLDAQNDVGAGAAARLLLQEAAAAVKRRHQASLRLLAWAPGLAEALGVALPPAGGAVPQHLLRPDQRGREEFHFSSFLLNSGGESLVSSPWGVAENVSTVKRVDGNALLYSALLENGVPAVKENFILMKGEDKITQVASWTRVDDGWRKRNLQVEDGDSLPVCFPDDAMEIL